MAKRRSAVSLVDVFIHDLHIKDGRTSSPKVAEHFPGAHVEISIFVQLYFRAQNQALRFV